MSERQSSSVYNRMSLQITKRELILLNLRAYEEIPFHLLVPNFQPSHCAANYIIYFGQLF